MKNVTNQIFNINLNKAENYPVFLVNPQGIVVPGRFIQNSCDKQMRAYEYCIGRGNNLIPAFRFKFSERVGVSQHIRYYSGTKVVQNDLNGFDNREAEAEIIVDPKLQGSFGRDVDASCISSIDTLGGHNTILPVSLGVSSFKGPHSSSDVSSISPKGELSLDIRHLSLYVRDVHLLSEDEVNSIDKALHFSIIKIIVVKDLVPKYLYNKILKDFRFHLDLIHINGNIVEGILDYIKNYQSDVCLSSDGQFKFSTVSKCGKTIDLEKLFFILVENAAKRSAKLNNDTLEQFFSLLNTVFEVGIEAIIEKSYNIVYNDLITGFINYGSNIQTRTVASRKHPGRAIEWSDSKYEKSFNDLIVLSLKRIKLEVLNCGVNLNHEINIALNLEVSKIQDIFRHINTIIAEELFKYKSQIIPNKTAPNYKGDEITAANIISIVNDNNINYTEMMSIMDGIESMVSLDSRIEKLSSLNNFQPYLTHL